MVYNLKLLLLIGAAPELREQTCVGCLRITFFCVYLVKACRELLLKLNTKHMSVKEKEERHEPKLITVFYLFLLFCILIMIVYFFLSFLHPLFLHFFPHHSLILLSLFSLFSPLTEVSTIHLSFLITLTILD